MGQQDGSDKVLAVEARQLVINPRTHIQLEGEDQLPKKLSSVLHKCVFSLHRVHKRNIKTFKN